jgi:hypothetical protein
MSVRPVYFIPFVSILTSQLIGKVMWAYLNVSGSFMITPEKYNLRARNVLMDQNYFTKMIAIICLCNKKDNRSQLKQILRITFM